MHFLKGVLLLKHENERTIIKKLRKKRGLTQAKTASYIGISKSFYAQVERGDRNPGTKNALKICDFFGIDIRKL